MLRWLRLSPREDCSSVEVDDERPDRRSDSSIRSFEPPLVCKVDLRDVGGEVLRTDYGDRLLGADDCRDAEFGVVSDSGSLSVELGKPDLDGFVCRRMTGEDLHRVFAGGSDDGAEADHSRDDADEGDEREGKRGQSFHFFFSYLPMIISIAA